MSPDELSESLRMLARYIDEDPSPSRQFVASSLGLAVSSVESDDGQVHVALFKELWRKLVKSPGERKVLDKMDRLKKARKLIPSVLKAVRGGADLGSLASDPDKGGVLFMAVERASGTSSEFKENAPDDADGIEAFATHMDEWWSDEGEDEEESDRDAIEAAMEKLDGDLEERAKDMEISLKKKTEKKKKGGKLQKDVDADEAKKAKKNVPLKKGEREKPEAKSEE